VVAAIVLVFSLIFQHITQQYKARRDHRGHGDTIA